MLHHDSRLNISDFVNSTFFSEILYICKILENRVFNPEEKNSMTHPTLSPII